MAAIGFLHTAEVHRTTFDRLLSDQAPEVSALHVVDEPLLATAIAAGEGAELGRRVRARLVELEEAGADVIICTCSTLGGLAEDVSAGLAVPVLRVDRPMAERAAAFGGRIGVVYAVSATAEPTLRLLADCLRGSQATVRPVACLDAWAWFERGDLSGYRARVGEEVRRVAPTVDVVVLAQASMAAVAEDVEDLGVPVLASPRLAVERAVALAQF